METLDYTSLAPKDLALCAVRAVYEKQGFDVKLYHVEDSTIITDYYVICTGRSADEACYRLDLGGVHAAHIEGRDTGTWILLDFGSVIVHVFSRDDRDFYKLDRLLPEGTEVDITDFLAQLDREAKGE